MENTTPSQPRRLAEHTTAPRSPGQRSRRKPFNRDAGYHCSKRTAFGYCVVYDREKGGDWIDADTRWVAAAFDNELRNMALLDCTSERMARDIMKDASLGNHDWITRTDA